MSVADGGQIFVGQSVYDTLSYRRKYLGNDLFKHYTVTVKHDRRIEVYQYVAEGNPGLNTNAQPTLKEEEAAALFKSATACGLTRVYHSRDEVKANVLSDIENAEQRVWICGIGLAETITLTNALSSLDKNPRPVKVKILLLDALRSTALFRTFLEYSHCCAWRNRQQ